MRSVPFHSARHAVVLLALLTLAACGGGGGATEPPPDVTGSYVASVFKATTLAGTTDVLAAGGSIAVTLTPQGTTTGRLLVPASVLGTALDQDLAGSWTLTGNTVRFTVDGQSILGQVPFTVSGAELVADATLLGARVQVTLTHPATQ